MNVPTERSGKSTGDLSPFVPAAALLLPGGPTQASSGPNRRLDWLASGKTAGIIRRRLEKDGHMGNPGLELLRPTATGM